MLNNQLLKKKLRLYYITTIFSLFFAVVGFSYNAWRLEVSEDNNNIRTASFEVLKSLAEFEQVVFSAHYDQDESAGNPRLGWIKIGLVVDLSVLISPEVESSSALLKQRWNDNWSTIQASQNDISFITDQIDEVRANIKAKLADLN
ncbi:MAG: hypothetical protein HRT53_19320 [Colwellia sp.]|nr:hypothetical protein [Colwellia sp.]